MKENKLTGYQRLSPRFLIILFIEIVIVLSTGNALAEGVCGDGIVDRGEACDEGVTNGASACGCQLNCTFTPAGTACGNSSDTVCDNPDTCSGTGACQPNFEPATVLCRADAGECDVPEFCDGAGICPANGFEPPGAACGDPSDTICDNPDTCNATGVCQPNHEPPTVLCRADAGECDVPEFCDAAGICPANGFEPPGAACGDPSDTICDNPDTCNDTGVCQPNHEPPTVLCRADAGECDVPEYCDAAGICPANGFEPPGAACGDPSDTICDNPDTCNAAGACQLNFEAATVPCRADEGECDVPEFCDGAGICPANGFEPAGTVCRAAAGGCDLAEVCDGEGNCPAVDILEPRDALCRASAGLCDPFSEFCTGASAFCPADWVRPASIGSDMYDSIGLAYTAAAASGDTIKAIDSILPTLIFDDIENSKSIILQGGYNCNFALVVSRTIIDGSITISSGAVQLADIIIQ